MIIDINFKTGEQTIRQLTVDELSEREAIALEQAQREAEAQAKIETRQSALAKLAALGLTQDEIDAL